MSVLPHQPRGREEFGRAAQEEQPAGRLAGRQHRRLRFRAGVLVSRWRRVSRRAALSLLVAEQRTLMAVREPHSQTYGEHLVRRLGHAGARQVMAGSEPAILKLARLQDEQESEVTRLQRRAEAELDTRIPHPVAGDITVRDALLLHEDLTSRITSESSAGSGPHLRLTPWVRRAPKFVAGCDLAVLIWFTAGVFNVDWTHPLSVVTVLAVTFALLATGVSFLAFTLSGHLLRRRRDDDGQIPWTSLGATTSAWLGLAGVLAVGLSVLMYIRVAAEIHDALGDSAGATGPSFATVFALISLVANSSVAVVAALDGSETTDQVDRIAMTIRGPLQRADRWNAKAADVALALERTKNEAERQVAAVHAAANDQLDAADQAIDAARAVHGGVGGCVAVDTSPYPVLHGLHSPPASPVLDLALRHINEAAARVPAQLNDDENAVERPSAPARLEAL